MSDQTINENLYKIAKNLEKIAKLQKEQNELLRQLIDKQPSSVPTYVTAPQPNPDWLSPPPGYVGDWLPTRK